MLKLAGGIDPEKLYRTTLRKLVGVKISVAKLYSVLTHFSCTKLPIFRNLLLMMCQIGCLYLSLIHI